MRRTSEHLYREKNLSYFRKPGHRKCWSQDSCSTLTGFNVPAKQHFLTIRLQTCSDSRLKHCRKRQPWKLSYLRFGRGNAWDLQAHTNFISKPFCHIHVNSKKHLLFHS